MRKAELLLLYNGTEAAEDLKEYIEKFSFTDSIDASDTISLTLHDREKNGRGVGYRTKMTLFLLPYFIQTKKKVQGFLVVVFMLTNLFFLPCRQNAK